MSRLLLLPQGYHTLLIWRRPHEYCDLRLFVVCFNLVTHVPTILAETDGRCHSEAIASSRYPENFTSKLRYVTSLIVRGLSCCAKGAYGVSAHASIDIWFDSLGETFPILLQPFIGNKSQTTPNFSLPLKGSSRSDLA